MCSFKWLNKHEIIIKKKVLIKKFAYNIKTWIQVIYLGIEKPRPRQSNIKLGRKLRHIPIHLSVLIK